MLTIINSTISGNTAGAAEQAGMGGGIYNNGATLTITNSTVSNNTAWTDRIFGGDGGGILSGAGGTLEISNTALAATRPELAAGACVFFSVHATLTNSTISGNTAGFQFPPTGFGGGLFNADTER